MEEGRDDFMQRANEEPPEAFDEERGPSSKTIIIIFVFLCITNIVAILISVRYGLLNTWYFKAFFSVSILAFLFLCFFLTVCNRTSRAIERNIAPGGLHRRAAQGGPHALVHRRPEIVQMRNINAAGSSRSSRVTLLDTVDGPSGLQNPWQLFRSDDSSHNLQLGQQRTQAESTLSQEGSSPLRSVSGETFAASKMSDVASGVSDIASQRTAGRERIRTRSMTKKQLEEASTSSAGQEVDPSVPGTSYLQSPERPVRHLRSKKIESDSQQSDRQSAPKSSLSERSTAASGVVRRREKFEARKGSVEKKLDSDDSESYERSESEQD